MIQPRSLSRMYEQKNTNTVYRSEQIICLLLLFLEDLKNIYGQIVQLHVIES